MQQAPCFPYQSSTYRQAEQKKMYSHRNFFFFQKPDAANLQMVTTGIKRRELVFSDIKVALYID